MNEAVSHKPVNASNIAKIELELKHFAQVSESVSLVDYFYSNALYLNQIKATNASLLGYYTISPGSLWFLGAWNLPLLS